MAKGDLNGIRVSCTSGSGSGSGDGAAALVWTLVAVFPLPSSM